jgi:hypothetical protein
MRSTSAGVTIPQRGDAVPLLLPISADRSTPSANIRLRALCPSPEVRVWIGACTSPIWRLRMTMLGRYLRASSTLMTLIVCSICSAVTPAVVPGRRYLSGTGRVPLTSTGGSLSTAAFCARDPDVTADIASATASNRMGLLCIVCHPVAHAGPKAPRRPEADRSARGRDCPCARSRRRRPEPARDDT